MKLEGRLALITGGGRGIGREIAIAFSREGAETAVAARSLDQIHEVALSIHSETGRKSIGLSMDVCSAESIQEAFSKTLETFGRSPDILVNNAGMAASAPLTRTTDELWNRVIATNLTGAFLCTRAALPSMLESGWGRIINIASIAGKAGAAYLAAYASSKHGLIGLTRAAALEVARKGITVNAICPAFVDTEMARSAVKNIVAKTGMADKDALENLLSMNPQHRLVTSEEVAAVALMLASEDGRGLNGQAINVDGGAVFY